MFYAIDKNTGKIILSLNVRDRNYKDTYNKELRFKCAGFCENGKECHDENLVFVNSKQKQSHFRHSSASKCSAHKAYIEFNNNFYSNWFNLFRYEYRKPYWYNCKLEQISDDNNVIIVRYSQQKSDIIKNIEKYAQNKIIWILSLENRKYSEIKVYKGKIFVDFIGSKNDIPLYDDSKSIVYLDTDTDILLKVLLNSTSCYGQEVECINIYDICNDYEHLFIAYPYRKKDTFFRSLMIKQKEYINNILYDEYVNELNILLNETCNWKVLSYLEDNHKKLKQKWYLEKQKILEEKHKQELTIQSQKNKEKIKRQQKKLLQEKQQADYEKELIRKRLEQYSKEYELQDTQLTTKLLDIINDNYSKILLLPIKSINDLDYINYIKKYYTYITFPINHNLNKMILYIIKQEEYLQNI